MIPVNPAIVGIDTSDIKKVIMMIISVEIAGIALALVTEQTGSSVTAALIPDDKIEIVTTSMISLYVRFPFSNVPFVKNI